MKFKIFFLIIITINFFSCSSPIIRNGNWINTNIAGNYLEEKPSVKDDFYQAINYEHFINAKENNEYTGMGYNEINNIISENLRQLNEENNLDLLNEKKKFVDLYRMMINWKDRDFKGIEPILPIIKKIQSIRTLDEISELLKDDEARLFFPLKVNLRNSDGLNHIPEIEISYLFNQEVDCYFDFYKYLLSRIGYTEKVIQELIINAYNFENQYSVNLKKGNVSYSRLLYANQIDKEYKNLPLKDYLYYSGIPDLCYKIKKSDEMKSLDAIFTENNIESVKSLWICKVLINSAALLDSETFNQYMILNEKLYGQGFSKYDDTIPVKILNTYVPEFLGKIWCTEFCSEELFRDVENLALEILEKYKQIISEWAWLNTGSRYNLIELLNKTKVIAGHSSFYDYSNLELTENLYSSIMSIIIYEKKLYAKKCYLDFDKYEWTVAPQVFNAFYNGANNSINIHAGYIYGIKYNSQLSIEEKYATLGYVIAHEISHVFSLPDENGVIYQRLNKTDHEELEKKLNLLADYFSTFEIVDGIKCNGTLCKGEIGADLFGLNAVINLAKTNKSFDYELFFLTLAEEYYYVTSEQIMVINNDRDTHPPHYLRVNAIIQQFDEFYETYNIKWWNGMYLSHKKRMRF